RLFGSIGCLACHQAQGNKTKEEKEQVFLQRPGTFPLTGLGSKTTPERLAAYLNNPAATDPSGRMPHMQLHGNEAPELARYLCESRDATIKDELPDAPPRDKVLDVFQQVERRAEEQADFQRLPTSVQLILLGKRLVIEKGCNNCHTIAPGDKP